jgi:hypothetical protein
MGDWAVRVVFEAAGRSPCGPVAGDSGEEEGTKGPRVQGLGGQGHSHSPSHTQGFQARTRETEEYRDLIRDRARDRARDVFRDRLRDHRQHVARQAGVPFDSLGFRHSFRIYWEDGGGVQDGEKWGAMNAERDKAEDKDKDQEQVQEQDQGQDQGQDEGQDQGRDQGQDAASELRPPPPPPPLLLLLPLIHYHYQ